MKERLDRLDGLRFIMIFTIVFSHLEFLRDLPFGSFYWTYIHNPTLGVDFFFMLSGFGLFYSMVGREVSTSITGSVRFAIGKIKKIYPAYVISLLISIPMHFWFSFRSAIKIVLKFTGCLTLLQNAFGMMWTGWALNGVCWFLSTLFICYIASPLLISFCRRLRSRRHIFFCAGVSIVAIMVLSFIFRIIEESVFFHGEQVFDVLVYGSPYIRIWYVLLGMIAAAWYCAFPQDFAVKERYADVREALCAVGLIVYALFRNTLYDYFGNALRFVDVCAAYLLLCVAVKGGGFVSRILGTPFLARLGREWSMYIYLFHYPIRFYIDDVCSLLHIPDSFRGPLEVALILVFTAIFSFIVKTAIAHFRTHRQEKCPN